MRDKLTTKNIIIAVLLLALAFISFKFISDYATSTEVHANSIASLDDKKVTAMELTAGVAVTSTAISALPGDAATPVAEQVSELTGPLLVVICAIYLEKFLLTTIGYIAFKALIPIACLLGIIYIFVEKEHLRTFSVKLALFAVVVSLAIPASVKVTSLIEDTFAESITQTYDTAEELSGEAEKSTEKEDKSGFMGFLKDIGDEVTGLADSAKNALSVFIDAIAVMLITTCVIPILVVMFFLWIIKMIFGLNIDMRGMRRLLPGKLLK